MDSVLELDRRHMLNSYGTTSGAGGRGMNAKTAQRPS
jgi:hypothetical protein